MHIYPNDVSAGRESKARAEARKKLPNSTGLMAVGMTRLACGVVMHGPQEGVLLQ